METEPKKETEPKGPKARLVFRWLAGITSLVMLLMGVLSLFPQAGFVEQLDWETVALFLWSGLLFGAIAITGYLDGYGERSEFSKRIAAARAQLKAGKEDDASNG